MITLLPLSIYIVQSIVKFSGLFCLILTPATPKSQWSHERWFYFVWFFFFFCFVFDLKPNTTSLNFFFIKYKFDKFIVRLYFFVNIQTKVCGAIGYELTFLALKAFINYISLKFLGFCILVLPLKLQQPLLLAHYSQLFVSLAFI